jgi:hypothetical protein
MVLMVPYAIDSDAEDTLHRPVSFLKFKKTKLKKN